MREGGSDGEGRGVERGKEWWGKGKYVPKTLRSSFRFLSNFVEIILPGLRDVLSITFAALLDERQCVTLVMYYLCRESGTSTSITPIKPA